MPSSSPGNPPGGTRVYLVRHAHAHWSTDEARPLSPAGAAAAEIVAARLASEPIRAIYSSTSQRAIETVQPAASRLGVNIQLIHDLRERELPPVSEASFERAVLDTWGDFSGTPHGGEPNAAAQARGIAVLQRVLARHPGEDVVLATHGTLLVLILNALDANFGYAFWQGLSFPDIYRVSFAGDRFVNADRVWKPMP